MSNLLEQFHICENRCSHLDPSTIKEYFPNGGFDKARKDFFKVVEADVKKFYGLQYPFVGRIVFDGNVFKNLVRIIPEFIVGIIKTGMPAIITLGEFETYEENDPVQLSHKNLLHASELVIESANLLNAIGLENSTPALIKRLNNKLRLLQINKSHYDLLGILQSIHSSTVLAANSMNLLEPGINHLYFHADQKKREILYSIVGPILNPLRTVATLGAGTEINAVKPLILAEIEKYGPPKLISSATIDLNQIDVGHNSYSQKASINSELNKVQENNETPDPGEPSAVSHLAINNMPTKKITLIPMNPKKRKHQNQIILGDSNPKILANAPFDFLYWIAWCDKNGASQLKAGEALSQDYKNQILEGCTEKISSSRFDGTWTNKSDAAKKWDAQSQINKLLGFELVQSSAGIFSINSDNEFELKPYPTK
jgi:hypothetical protein